MQLQQTASPFDLMSLSTEHIQRCFRNAWPQASRFPDIEACRAIMVAIKIIDQFSLDAPPNLPPGARKAAKYGRLFLRHLNGTRGFLVGRAATLERLRHVRSPPPPYSLADLDMFPDNEAQAVKVEGASQAVQAALKVLDELTNREPPFELECFIADLARAAWQNVGVKVALSGSSPANPMCAFVASVLIALGRPHRSFAVISDALRGRRQRRR